MTHPRPTLSRPSETIGACRLLHLCVIASRRPRRQPSDGCRIGVAATPGGRLRTRSTLGLRHQGNKAGIDADPTAPSTPGIWRVATAGNRAAPPGSANMATSTIDTRPC